MFLPQVMQMGVLQKTELRTITTIPEIRMNFRLTNTDLSSEELLTVVVNGPFPMEEASLLSNTEKLIPVVQSDNWRCWSMGIRSTLLLNLAPEAESRMTFTPLPQKLMMEEV